MPCHALFLVFTTHLSMQWEKQNSWHGSTDRVCRPRPLWVGACAVRTGGRVPWTVSNTCASVLPNSPVECSKRGAACYEVITLSSHNPFLFPYSLVSALAVLSHACLDCIHSCLAVQVWTTSQSCCHEQEGDVGQGDVGQKSADCRLV